MFCPLSSYGLCCSLLISLSFLNRKISRNARTTVQAGMTFFSINDTTLHAQVPFQHKSLRMCGQLISHCQGQQYICSSMHSFPLILSACQALSQALCAPQIKEKGLCGKMVEICVRGRHMALHNFES